MDFKYYLLNEDRVNLGQKIGDLLNASQDLEENGASMGMRQLAKNALGIVSQIRRIIHSNWTKEQEKYLRKLQKVGVAIMRTIEEKDDLKEILPSVSQELQSIQTELGVPLNKLATPQEDKTPEETLPTPAPEDDNQGLEGENLDDDMAGLEGENLGDE